MKKQREFSENSLKNLKKFTKDYQPSQEARCRGSQKGWQTKKEFKAMKDAATDILMKQLPNGETFQEVALNKIAEMIINGEIKATELIKAIEFLRDTSGQKPTETQEVKMKNPPSINIGFKI